MMKVTTATVIGLVIGLIAGFIASRGSMLGGVSQLSSIVQRNAWTIVVLSMLVPLIDYLKGMRSTVTGALTGHPLHQLAGFFMGLAAGLGLFLLFIVRMI